MPREAPASPEELQERLDVIEAQIVEGMRKRDIVRYVREHDHELNWGVTERQVRNYYDQAQARMAARATRLDRAMYFTRSVERLDHIYHKASRREDTRQMESVTMNLIKLLHLDDPSHELDWREEAAKAGINPDNFLKTILQQHAEMNALEQDN